MKLKDKLQAAYGAGKMPSEGKPAAEKPAGAPKAPEASSTGSAPQRAESASAAGGALLKTGRDSYAKVARFLLLLGKDEAAKVLSCLSPSEIEGISAEIAKVSSVDSIEANQILSEFGWLLKTKAYSTEGGPDTAEKMLRAAFGEERAREFMRKAAPERSKPFAFLESFSSEQVLVVLGDENPRIISVVLPFMPPKKASEIIAKLDEKRRGEVVKHIASLEKVAPEAVRGVEEGLKQKLLKIAHIEEERIDGRSALAEILRNVDPTLGEAILSKLDEDAPALSRQIRERLFTPEDLLAIPAKHLQSMLMGFDEKTIALALKGREEAFRSGLLSHVSNSRRAMIEDEYALLGSVKRDDAREALNRIVAEGKRRYEDGDFALEGDDDLVD
jgi:flagellar motor switch protein FliG